MHWAQGQYCGHGGQKAQSKTPRHDTRGWVGTVGLVGMVFSPKLAGGCVNQGNAMRLAGREHRQKLARGTHGVWEDATSLTGGEGSLRLA